MGESIINVLLIDDEPALLDISKRFLELDHSIKVDTSLSATDALKRIQRREYDVLVSDYQMPIKDGIQLLKELRTEGNSIPFIIFTGKGREEVAIEALNAVADFYLQKGGQSASQFAELANMIKQAFIRKEGERKLRISEERFRSLFENSVDAVMLTTKDFEDVISANPSACKMFGMTEDEIRNTGIKGLIIEDKAWDNILMRLNQTGISKGEFTYRRKDGTTFTGETTHGILTGIYGIARISMIVRDITDRKIADEAIRDSEMRFRTYVDSAPEGIFIVDVKGNYQDVNRTACSMLKYSREELLGLNIKDLTKKSVAREALDGFNRLKKKGKLTMETILVRKDGIDIPIFLNAVELPNKMYMAFCTDILERKRAVDALKESEERYRQLVDSASESIIVIQDGSLCMVNPMAIKVIGHSEKELLSRSFCSFVHPDDRPMVVENYQRRIMGEVVPDRYELRLITKEGSIKWFEISAVVIDWEGRPATLNFLMDITERKHAADALKESEEKYRNVFDWANDAIMLHTLTTETTPGHFIDVNKVACDMLGYSKEELLTMGPLDIVPPEFHPQLVDIIRSSHTRDSVLFETTLQRKDGTTVPVESSSYLVDYEEKKIWISHIRDITKRKQNEEALKNTKEKYESLYNQMLDCIYISDLEGNNMSTNAALLALLGYTKEEMSSLNFFSMLDPEQVPRMLENVEGIKRTGSQKQLFEFRLRRKNGEYIDLEASAAIVYEKGVPYAIHGVARDITERKRMEDTIKRGEIRLREVLDATPFPVALVDLQDDKISYWSRSARVLFGHTAPTAAEWYEMAYPDPEYRQEVIVRWKPFLELARSSSKTVNTGEFRVTCEDGSVRICELYATFLIDSLIVTFNDVTERKKAEDAMRNNQAQLRVAMDLAKLVHWEYDVDKDLFTFDDQFYALYGSNEENEGGQLMSSAAYAKKFIPPEEAGVVAEETAKAISTMDPNYVGNVTHTIIKSDGERRIINVMFGVVKDASGRTVKTFGANQDVTELKRAEEALKAANKKLSLLSGITRHDIKNQLMALDGNLTLLSMKELDPASKELLRKSDSALNRISAMIRFTKEYEDVGVKDPIWHNVRAVIEKEATGVALGTIKLVNDVPADIEVYADPLITKVFHNLIDNAVRHGSKITSIHFSFEEREGSHAIVCEDDGFGIPSDKKGKLFMHDSRKKHGFGLFLSYEILAITGITIKEVGEPEHGAKFLMTIPSSGFRDLRQRKNE